MPLPDRNSFFADSVITLCLNSQSTRYLYRTLLFPVSQGRCNVSASYTCCAVSAMPPVCGRDTSRATCAALGGGCPLPASSPLTAFYSG